MSFDLREFQKEHREWVDRNFPHQNYAQNRHQSFLGVVEEMGELAHVILKSEQGIRDGMATDETYELLVDGVGDLVIFLAGFCDTHGINLDYAVSTTWNKVKQRDWVADPQRGGE